MEFAEEIRDFLIESNENLGALDQEIVELEKNPTDERLIASVFRTIHTIKGTSGFFGFDILGSVTHVAENILGQVREKQRALTPELVSLVLQTVDAVRSVLAHVEQTGGEGDDVYHELRQRLDDAFHERSEVILARPEAAAPKATSVRKERRNRERVQAERIEAASLPDGPARQAKATLEAGSQRDTHSVVHLSSSPPPAAPEHRAAGAPEVASKRADEQGLANSTIRVDVGLLDKLMNLVGELVLARNQLLQGPVQSPASSATAQRLNLITSELQEGVMRTRMQPIGVVWNKLPRVVRDLASEMGKKIELEMEGAETELDKTIIEAIKDPLTHIVRNSCDHGIESAEDRLAKGKNPAGTILMRAFHEGGHVNIEISDDGAGIDPENVKAKAVQKGLVRPEQIASMNDWEALRLIFLPGFSTAEKVTSISGRGVGMDVVRTNIEKIGGTVDLSNRAGSGTSIKIKIPLTLAIIPGLIVSVNSVAAQAELERPCAHRFVIPQANLLELVRLESEKDLKQIERIQGAQVYRRRGKLLPLAYLSDVLGLPSSRTTSDVMNIVVVRAEETAFGLIVDQVNDTQEIVVKALGSQLKALSCYVGATIMGDGKIALILDVMGLARLAHMLAPPVERTRLESRTGNTNARQMLLLFRAGNFSRLVLPLSMVARLEEIGRDRIEYAAGAPVVRYREGILPLISLASVLDAGSPASGMTSETLQVIVFTEGDRSVGIVVDEILDIVDDAVTIKRPGSAKGLLGSGVVGGKVTDFVDLATLLDADPSGLESSLAGAAKESGRLLLVDSRKIPRGVLRSYLEMHGHQVVESSNIDDAMRALESVPFDVIITALDLGGQSGHELVQAVRSHVEFMTLPVLGIRAEQDRSQEQGFFTACIDREDRSGLLHALRSAISPLLEQGSAFEMAGSLQ